ncbi:MAG: hypothetical protein HC837_10690 [Chloroflexaceae bacterium]|nr:hypothetical protein [Chloroflexaceae bacterium]
MSRHWPHAIHVRAVLLITLLLLITGVILEFAPEPPGPYNQADQLFLSGQYQAALAAYQQLHQAQPSAATDLRLGTIYTIRDDSVLAEQHLWHAVELGLAPLDYDLAMLYLGQLYANRNNQRQAQQSWERVRTCATPQNACPYDGPRYILAAQWALQQGDYTAAETSLHTALQRVLAPEWWQAAQQQLALLQAASDPAAALNRLQRLNFEDTADNTDTTGLPWIKALLPSVAYDTQQLIAIVQTDEPQRSQLLGQLYLERRWYDLAEAQFAAVDPSSTTAIIAAAHRAYSRWRSGDRSTGRAWLRSLVQTHPNLVQVRMLLTLAYLAEDNRFAARIQLFQLNQLAPQSPDTLITWAAWYIYQHEYVQASRAYQRALSLADDEQKGRYALFIATIHQQTTYEVCTHGVRAAEEATRRLPDESQAWNKLAAIQYTCGEFDAAVETARIAFAVAPGPEPAFYLGAALMRSGYPSDGRTMLVQAADMAPASIWRERVEDLLAWIEQGYVRPKDTPAPRGYPPDQTATLLRQYASAH